MDVWIDVFGVAPDGRRFTRSCRPVELEEWGAWLPFILRSSAAKPFMAYGYVVWIREVRVRTR